MYTNLKYLDIQNFVFNSELGLEAKNLEENSPPPKATVSQMGAGGTPTGAPKGGAEGATPLGGEGNPAEGGYFASYI